MASDKPLWNSSNPHTWRLLGRTHFLHVEEPSQVERKATPFSSRCEARDAMRMRIVKYNTHAHRRLLLHVHSPMRKRIVKSSTHTHRRLRKWRLSCAADRELRRSRTERYVTLLLSVTLRYLSLIVTPCLMQASQKIALLSQAMILS